MAQPGSPEDPRFIATVELIRRTGASSFQVRYSDDEEPVVWLAVANFQSPEAWEVGAGQTPLRAIWRLAETLLDGGQCRHCERPTAVTDDWTGRMPLDELVCWYRYDPELKTYRRSCE